MGVIKFDLGSKERNEIAERKAKVILGTDEEIKPRASEVIDEDSIIGLGNSISKLIKEMIRNEV